MNSKMKNKFWRFQNIADGSAELVLYGDIANESWWGDEVTPKEFKRELDELGNVQNITVRINSGGGDVWAAQTIGNNLEQNAAFVTAHIDGLCASAATIVACHCDKVEAAADTSYMIHPVQVGICGYVDADKLEQYKQALDSIKENIIGLYEKKTGQSREDLIEWMDATSWWTAAQAQEKGFVDEVIGGSEAVTTENRDGLLFVNSVSMAKLPFDAAPKFLQDKAAPAAPENKTPAGAPGNTTTQEEGNKTMEIKTIDDARKEIPELVKQIEDNARAAARTDEQKRLQEIDEISKLYPADMVAAAKYGEQACDAKELAWRGAQANAKKGESYLANRAADVAASGVQNVASAPPANANPADGENEIIGALKKRAGKQ